MVQKFTSCENARENRAFLHDFFANSRKIQGDSKFYLNAGNKSDKIERKKRYAGRMHRQKYIRRVMLCIMLI